MYYTGQCLQNEIFTPTVPRGGLPATCVVITAGGFIATTMWLAEVHPATSYVPHSTACCCSASPATNATNSKPQHSQNASITRTANPHASLTHIHLHQHSLCTMSPVANSYLLCGCPKTKKAFIEAGALEAVMRAMDHFPRDRHLQAGGCDAISSIVDAITDALPQGKNLRSLGRRVLESGAHLAAARAIRRCVS